MPRRRTIRSLKENTAARLAEAQQLMSQASAQLKATDKLVVALVAQAMQTLLVVCDGVEEVMDGVEFEATVLGYKVPISIRLKPREDEPDGS